MYNMYKKGLSIFLVLLMVLGGISGVIVPSGGTAHAATTDFAGGTGTGGDPYQIANAFQLNAVRNYLGNTLHFKLTANINLSSYTYGSGWNPIGDTGIPFSGYMEGNGFEITNLKINTPGRFGIGLFSRNAGTITNIILKDIDVIGSDQVGGLVGINAGSISNSYVTGHVYGANIIGGMVGENNGFIENSYSTVSVNGFQTVGGLVGSNDVLISKSYATGSVSGNKDVGGLVGSYQFGTINTSYATGSVNGNETVGGVVGSNDNSTGPTHSFYDSDTTGQTDTGNGTGKTTEEMKTSTTFSDWDFINDWYMLAGHYPQLWSLVALTPGKKAGTTKLTGVVSGMEYKINTGSYTMIMDTSVDNIAVEVGDRIYIRVKENAQLASVEKQIQRISIREIKIQTMTTGTISGVTAPEAGAAPVTTLTGAAQYTAAITWSPVVDAKFAGAETYTATITLKPKTGYTFTGVPANSFTVVGATTITNGANDGVVTAVFPATAAPIQTEDIAGVTVPVTGEVPLATMVATAEYTASIDWAPTDATFAGAAIYTAKISLTPKPGYTLEGVPANFFKVAGATTTTNDADDGVVTAVFPATAALPIPPGAIVGVTAPVAGVTPVTTLADTVQYTSSITWSPIVDAKFAGAETYTARITLKPKAGYTLTGVGKDSFTVAGATTTTNEADDGVVTAVFPATAALPIPPGAIVGVTAPVAGAIPVTTLADTVQYTSSITWSPIVDAKFAGAETYTATITLKPKAGYTLTGVGKDSFTVAGATTTTNEADDGVVTALFPATAAPIQTRVIAGVTVPVTGEVPLATMIATAEYTASIDWAPTDATFAGAVIYTAKISLTPKPGYTLAGVPANFFTVAGATTTTNEADDGVVTAVFPATAALPIPPGAIVGVTAPVAGATPVTTLADTVQYTSSITWSPIVDATFAGAETYTATITLKPKAGYTLTGVGKDSFTVSGATTTTNGANDGVVTAVFPATTALPITEVPVTIVPITTAGIAGVTAPVTGATPVTTVTYSAEYTATLTWLPTTTLFVGETAYTALIIITPRAGHTLAGVPANFFTVVGATTTNAANSGVVIAEFPTTAALPVTVVPVTIVPITTAGIAGVTAPITGATPVTTVTYSAEYTATVSWSPTTTLFAEGTAYTATITITPKAGYTLTGVLANFFNVAGATTTNAADSGIVMAVFPATQPVSTGTDTGSTFTPPSNTIVTSTNGTLTLPLNKSGEVSFEDAVKISIPVGAIDKELILTIEKVLDPQKLISNNEILLSPVFEMLKNFPENFNKSVTLNFTFDPTLLKSNQKASVFYYDELKKAWVEIGGKISGNKITVDSNHFTKFAVLAVGEATEVPSIDDPTEANFSDVAGHWAEANIKQAVSIGMVKGYLDGTFQPNHTVTRAEFAVMLMNVLKPQEAGADLTFTDTAKIGAWAQTAVAQAVQAGIITGYEDGGFRPNAEITRAEMAVILAKALGESTEVKLTTSFADDKDIPAWAKASVDIVKQAGMVQGKGDNEFAPQDSATRAEAVTVLLKLLAQLSN